MGRGLRVMIFCFCITAVFTLKASAQQAAAPENPNKAKIEQIRQDMKGLEEQLKPLHAQMKQLMDQVKALREQMHPIVDKMKADRDQLRDLRGERHAPPQNPAGASTK